MKSKILMIHNSVHHCQQTTRAHQTLPIKNYFNGCTLVGMI